jgi:hypothetical protein
MSNKKSEEISSLEEAMLLAQRLIDHVVPDAKNSHFKNKYATYDAVVLAVKPHLNACGISFLQKTHLPPEGRAGVVVETVFKGYGEEVSFGHLFIEAQAQTPHGYGSALTYAKRYSLSTSCGLPNGTDDDAMAPEVETRKSVIAKRQPATAAPEGIYKLKAGHTVISAYATPKDLVVGCRDHIAKPRDLDCVAIFQSSESDIRLALSHSGEEGSAPDKEANDALRKMIGAYGGDK